MDINSLKRRMLELDELAFSLYPECNFECVIVGGGALILLKVIPRATLDVDVLEVSKNLEELFNVFDFNTRVQSLIYCFPYNYQDRLQKIDIDTQVIKYY